MGTGVPIKNDGFGKYCIRRILAFVLINLFVQIFKRGKIKELNLNNLNS